MKMPSNGFDSLAALARLNTDDTSHHRERWPSLAWVWDELDDLRAEAADAAERPRRSGTRLKQSGTRLKRSGTRCPRLSG